MIMEVEASLAFNIGKLGLYKIVGIFWEKQGEVVVGLVSDIEHESKQEYCSMSAKI